jgi:hypothetical protein
MLEWLRKILRCPSEPVRIEVTIHVAPVHIVTSGPEGDQGKSVNTECGSGAESEGKRDTLRSAPAVTGEEKLRSSVNKFAALPVPQVPFGEDSRK